MKDPSKYATTSAECAYMIEDQGATKTIGSGGGD